MSANVDHHRHHRVEPHRDAGKPLWVSAAAGLCASLVGLGLARFAYTPLIPALIAAKWFTPAEAVYLGAANLAGYLAGALIARDLGARIGSVWALRGMMVLAAISCFACAVPISFVWFFGFRFLAGISGGVIMVLAATAILPHTAPSKRGLIGGVIFAGVGLGIAASGTLVPLLLQQGVKQAWYGLGALSAVLTLISWKAWPAEAPAAHVAAEPPVAMHGVRSPLVLALCVEYGLNALALVPHMVFLVDFVARGLGQGIAAGSYYWVLYGIGAVVGPLLTGHLADRAGFAAALRAAFLIEAVAVALPAVTTSPAALIVSSLIVGGFTPGIVPLVIGRIHELIPHSAASQRSAWAQATTTFALFQAAGAYGLSYLFAQSGGNYALLFVIGAAGVAAALAIELVSVLVLGRKPS
ncbi:YbfB/YjiJ family MFS transporter [Bradyrhizobium viridifuturi]|jgi:predicted MFS family arabinose efflux permease|nr:YbfB/YjiJ family MFS transporter [Bradyrhizobium viridifuturi]MCA3565810.1 YbfB/YjiJ family MFS transporter [Bradyrhizobium sp.]OYU62416.1 MAG: MFS transporter [Bradyrhizobium sp. PARBB1]PSO22848.1 MFS transporter [Bradyrhizobium sp. MOS004]QRI73455.1 YbfB/YjiJ family MFS transporter [Bradyrhizobium sp. PSBB068]